MPQLHEHFAACDLAVVQREGTSLLELTVLGRPFFYFPLPGHPERMFLISRSTWATRSQIVGSLDSDYQADLIGL